MLDIPSLALKLGLKRLIQFLAIIFVLLLCFLFFFFHYYRVTTSIKKLGQFLYFYLWIGNNLLIKMRDTGIYGKKVGQRRVKRWQNTFSNTRYELWSIYLNDFF